MYESTNLFYSDNSMVFPLVWSSAVERKNLTLVLLRVRLRLQLKKKNLILVLPLVRLRLQLKKESDLGVITSKA